MSQVGWTVSEKSRPISQGISYFGKWLWSFGDGKSCIY